MANEPFLSSSPWLTTNHPTPRYELPACHPPGRSHAHRAAAAGAAGGEYHAAVGDDQRAMAVTWGWSQVQVDSRALATC